MWQQQCKTFDSMECIPVQFWIMDDGWDICHQFIPMIRWIRLCIHCSGIDGKKECRKRKIEDFCALKQGWTGEGWLGTGTWYPLKRMALAVRAEKRDLGAMAFAIEGSWKSSNTLLNAAVTGPGTPATFLSFMAIVGFFHFCLFHSSLNFGGLEFMRLVWGKSFQFLAYWF